MSPQEAARRRLIELLAWLDQWQESQRWTARPKPVTEPPNNLAWHWVQACHILRPLAEDVERGRVGGVPKAWRFRVELYRDAGLLGTTAQLRKLLHHVCQDRSDHSMRLRLENS